MLDVYVRFRHQNGEEQVFRDQVPGPVGLDFDLEVIERLCRAVTPGLVSAQPLIVDTPFAGPALTRALRASQLKQKFEIQILEAKVGNQPYTIA